MNIQGLSFYTPEGHFWSSLSLSQFHEGQVSKKKYFPLLLQTTVFCWRQDEIRRIHEVALCIALNTGPKSAGTVKWKQRKKAQEKAQDAQLAQERHKHFLPEGQMAKAVLCWPWESPSSNQQSPQML